MNIFKKILNHIEILNSLVLFLVGLIYKYKGDTNYDIFLLGSIYILLMYNIKMHHTAK